MKKLLSMLSATVLLAALAMPISAEEELLLHDPMENFKNMVGYSENMVYNDYNEDKPEFFEEYWNKPAIMKFAGGPLDSWIMYDITDATRVEAVALIAERAVTDPLGIEPNHLIFETSSDQQNWTKVEAETKVREQFGKWTEAKYTLTDFAGDAKFLRITLYMPDGVPSWCSRVYGVDIYGVKPTQAPTTTAAPTTTNPTEAPTTVASTKATGADKTNASSQTQATTDEVSSVPGEEGGMPVGLIAGIAVAAVVVIAGVVVLVLYKTGKLPGAKKKEE